MGASGDTLPSSSDPGPASVPPERPAGCGGKVVAWLTTSPLSSEIRTPLGGRGSPGTEGTEGTEGGEGERSRRSGGGGETGVNPG